MAPKKKVLAVVTLQIKAAAATPAPPVGTALGQHGVNIMDFVNQYNAATQQYAGQVIPAVLTIYEDRTFSFILKQPPMAELIKQEAGIEKGSGVPNRDKVAMLSKDQLRGSRSARCPTSTRTTSTWRCGSSPARPDRWASTRMWTHERRAREALRAGNRRARP